MELIHKTSQVSLSYWWDQEIQIFLQIRMWAITSEPFEIYLKKNLTYGFILITEKICRKRERQLLVF